MLLLWRRRRTLYVLIGLAFAFTTYLSITVQLNGANLQHDLKRSSTMQELNIPLVTVSNKLQELSKDQGQHGTTASPESILEEALVRPMLKREQDLGSDASSVSKGENNKDGNTREATTILKEDSQLSNDTECLRWVNLAPKPPYYLTVVLLVRIYEKDKAKLTTAELKMWLQYLRYAGVEHVYVYDAFVYQNESQLPHLKEFLKDGYVTYIDWHTHNPYTISGTQVTAYQNCINVYKEECHWQAAIDIDEYPFSPKDQNQGFLFRFMKKYEEAHPQVSELSMQNFLFLGKPLKKELMIERLMRRTPRQANVLSKPIYKPVDINHAQVHHNSLRRGRASNALEEELRLNHYWGARMQNWGDDTEESLKKTIPDDSMKLIIRTFKQCKTLLQPYLT